MSSQVRIGVIVNQTQLETDSRKVCLRLFILFFVIDAFCNLKTSTQITQKSPKVQLTEKEENLKKICNKM